MTPAGVTWVNDYDGRLFDILICNRGVGNGYPEIRAKHRVLWTHDLPHNGFIPNPKTIKAFSATVFMSRYAENVWRTFYPDIGKGWLIPNGVNREIFKPGPYKDFDQMIYISNPNRGLDRLPLIYETVKRKLGRNLRMTAYCNHAVLHPNEGEDHHELKYKGCLEAGIELFDPIPQAKLGEVLGQAGLMVMPSGYPEICSNAVLQSLACGTPVITTGGLGATPEWVRHGKNGMLTQFQPQDYLVYQLEMVRNIIEVMNNPRVHRKMMMKAAQTKGIYTWQEIAWMWHRKLNQLS